jgi:hypothetical protein
MLEERIDDAPFLRLIRKWLKAGILETDGQVEHPATGTPQGGVVSPVLANVYLHYVLDLWFHWKVRRGCRGEACLIRYADDVVCAFEHAAEADRFLIDLETRLSRFGLKLSPTKTHRLAFSREGSGRESFDFLGFEFRWGHDRQGRAHLKRRTARKSLRKSLARFTLWCREHRHTPIGRLMRKVSQKLLGYYRYFGIYDNSRSVWQFHFMAMRILQKWLNRRSDRRSYNWAGFHALLEHFQIPYPTAAPPTRAKRS